MSTTFAHGDQFVGFHVNPSNGDLVLRYVIVVTNTPDANGRGVTSRVLESNRNIAKGRPLIFAPNESQGGTRGHTDFRKTSPYKYEVGRIINIEPASNNLLQRMRQNLVQTNSNSSSYVNLLDSEKDLWVADVIITNEEMKKILLNPATSHLIPRYVSPSFIHKRNPTGDYSAVNDAILDHIAIVNRPIYDPMSGKQIDGAAYGEVTRLRGSCFGEKVSCLNLLQTSSNKSVELDKCVSCPVQLLDRLTNLYKNIDIIQIVQSSSSNQNNMSNEQNPTTTTTNNQQPAPTQTNVTTSSTQGQGQTPIPDQQSVTISSNPLSSFFQTDQTLQNNYGIFKNLVTQVIKENQNEFKNVLMVDDNNNKSNVAGLGIPTIPNNNSPTDATTQNQNQVTDNVQTGETPQQESNTLTNEQVTQTLEKLKISEDELKNMKVEDIKKRFGDVAGMVKQILEEQTKTSRTLQMIREREEKAKIANILPKEAFSDERGFKQKEFDEMVSYLHKKKLDEQYIAILGVGLATLKNEQLKIREQQINLKKGNLPQGFGESIRQKIANSNNEPSTTQQQQQENPSPVGKQQQQQQSSLIIPSIYTTTQQQNQV